MKSVRKAVEKYIQKEETLDILINNAADFDLSVKKPILTKDGLEKQFATNVVRPFLAVYLVEGLLESLRLVGLLIFLPKGSMSLSLHEA